MRLLFLSLVLADLALAAWLLGVFGELGDNGREPGRVAQQIAPERVRVLDDAALARLGARAAPGSVPGSAPGSATGSAPGPAPGSAPGPAPAPTTLACIEFGDFTSDAGTGRAREKLSALNLGDRLTARSVQTPGWYMVYLPPMKTREEVDERAESLRTMGLRDFLVIADNSPMRFGIALGSFRDPELAKKHLADLTRRGLTGAKVSENPSTIAATRFQITGVDAATQQKLETLGKDFPQQKVQGCAAG